MKTDTEIKEFIDSREVLSKNDLCEFVYGIRRGYTSHERIYKWWEYVLRTKEWSKLRCYKEHKINNGNFGVENFNKYKEIYDKDLRIREAGSRKAQKILENVYSFHLARNIIINYKRKVQNELPKRDT